jgi:DNA-binding transcriptional LysR family regulator
MGSTLVAVNRSRRFSFVRSASGRSGASQLTDAGEFFLARAKALLRSAADAAAQTRAAAEPSRITIGYTTGLIVTPAVCELRHRYPDVDVRTVHLAGSCETRAALSASC